jgi:hypothetical protein
MVVGIATGHGLYGREVGVRIQTGKDFPFHVVQTGFGAKTHSYRIGTGGFFPQG